MRRLIALAGFATAAVAAACASMGTPPGGPPDKTPPQIVSITPDSGALNAHPKNVVFQFDETVNDRVARGALDQYFLISPMDGAPNVSYHRSRIEVRPRHGFKANTAYVVTLLPGLTDIRGNISNETRSVLFSTGPTIPAFGVLGHVWDWQNQRALANAVVEAISLPDSTIYIVAADSTGAYSLGPIPAGRYAVIGWSDQDKNRARNRTEIWDSTTVSITTSRPIVDLYALLRDTLPARMSSVTIDDSLSLHVVFDHALDPTQQFGTPQIRLVRADSTPLSILRVLTAEQADKERTDSTHRADSLAARTDTAAARRAAQADSARRALPPTAGTGRASAAAAPKPGRPAPPTTLVVRLAPQTPLHPGNYRITASAIRSIVGLVGSSSRTFVVPKPAPRDTTTRRVPADTTHRVPGDTARVKPPAIDTTRRPPPTSPVTPPVTPPARPPVR